MDNKDISLEIHAEQRGLRRPGPANRTILQKITDTLEAAGITVSGIETWPPEEDGRVSVSMTIHLQPEPKSEQDEKTAAQAPFPTPLCEETQKESGPVSMGTATIPPFPKE
jgi:hypothetical protein